MNILFDWINRKEGFFYFSIYTLIILRDSENIFLAVDAVSKLIERVNSLRTTIELFHFTFRRCTFMNCSNCSRLETPVFTFYLHILSRLRSTSILKFTSCCGYLYTAVPVYFLCNPFRGLSALSRNMEARCVHLSSRCYAFTFVLESSRSVLFVFTFGYLWI